MAGDPTLGFSCCMIAGIGFAINYLPVKSCDIGDGIFFSAAMSVGILLVGLLTGMFLSSTPGVHFPAFEPLAAVGGAMWMLGNLMCPYIIRIIGLGLGLTVWDLSNMLMGWFTGYFGLFGLPRDDAVNMPWANFTGLAMASVSLVFFSLASAFDLPAARSLEDKTASSEAAEASTVASPSDLPTIADIEDGLEPKVGKSGTDLVPREGSSADTSHKSKAVLGFVMAILAGVLFGSTFDLPMDLKHGDFGPDHSKHILDYVFSHFLGIQIAALIALIIYLMIRGKKSHMSRQLIVPSLASGVIWGIAQVAWFKANIEVGFAIAFPIIGSLPGIIGLIIGFCCLGEVRTRSSRIFAAVGLLLRVPGVLLIALSSV